MAHKDTSRYQAAAFTVLGAIVFLLFLGAVLPVKSEEKVDEITELNTQNMHQAMVCSTMSYMAMQFIKHFKTGEDHFNYHRANLKRWLEITERSAMNLGLTKDQTKQIDRFVTTAIIREFAGKVPKFKEEMPKRCGNEPRGLIIGEKS